MTSREKRKHDLAVAQAEVGYQLELARGASVIASMLSADNMAASIEETLSEFVSAYGTTDLKIFMLLLGQRLMARNRTDAANMLLTRAPASPATVTRRQTGRNAMGRANSSLRSTARRRCCKLPSAQMCAANFRVVPAW
jgi:hypothetical protein